ncbi:SBBP repeat-containing protein [bacterium AH-315-J21]|nr:SBBP repeat-containing protein [bacterium AH-315-J21]
METTKRQCCQLAMLLLLIPLQLHSQVIEAPKGQSTILSSHDAGAVSASKSIAVTRSMSSMPLAFTKNQGQWDEKAKFRANAGGATMWFSSDGAYYQFTRRIETEDSNPLSALDAMGALGSRDFANRAPDSIETMSIKASFVGAKVNPAIYGVDEMEYKCNYFIGNDPSEWHTDVPNYSAVMYEDVYNGIDLKYYGNGKQMEYDFIVSPGADFSQIKVQYEGAESVSVNDKGELVVTTIWGEVVERRPVIYQIVNNSRIPVSGVYFLKGDDSFGFKMTGDFDNGLSLVIDPVLSYSTYLGGSSDDAVNSIAVDGFGSAYVTGSTYSTDFPTINPYQTYQGSYDVFVTKLGSSGNNLLYSTYLGGSSEDRGIDIVVDGSGSTYVTGNTLSTDFPTLNPYQTDQGNIDAFVTKLSSSGNSLVYSTYLGGGGNEAVRAISVDDFNSVYIAGNTASNDFPTLGAYQSTLSSLDTADVFVTKLNSAGNDLVYSTYFGGNGVDNCADMAIDYSGNTYIIGWTRSLDLSTEGAFQTTIALEGIVIAKFNIEGNGLVYCTYLGGLTSRGYAITVDESNNAYVTGYIRGPAFPTTPNAYQTKPSYTGLGLYRDDVFVTKLSFSGDALVYSTYLGGWENDWGIDIAVDSSGSTFITGVTASGNFPTLDPYQEALHGYKDAFVTKLNSTGSSLAYSTFLGGSDDEQGYGIAVDGFGSAYVAGYTRSNNFPILNEYQSFLNGAKEAFVTKFTAVTPPVTAHVLLDSILVSTLISDTVYAPIDLPAIEAGSKIRIYGRVTDNIYTGISGQTVRCYDPITGDLFSGDSAVFRVVTDGSGSFIYPDTLVSPDGIACDRVDQYGLWFNSGDAAIPLSLMLYEDCGGYDCLSDSLQNLLAYSNFPEGTIVGTVDSLDQLYVPIKAYPLVDNDLGSTLNTEFFEGYAWSYNGDTVETFLHGPTGWLERGLVAHQQRTELVVSTLKDYSQQSATNVRILAIRGQDNWTMINKTSGRINKALWPENLAWNILSYGIEGAVCGVSLATVAGAPFGCAPLLISLSADLTKKYIVPATCGDELKHIDNDVCIATSESAIDVGAFVLTAAVSGGPQLAKHAGWFKNPRRLGKAARLGIALNIADDIHTFGEITEIGIDIGFVTAEYYYHPSTGSLESFGFSNLTYSGPRIPMLQGQNLQVMTTLRNDFNIQPSATWDNVTTPMFLNVAVDPDRGIFQGGSLYRGMSQGVPPSQFAPQCQILSQSLVYDIIWDVEDHDNLIYSASIPVSSLPGYVAGQPYSANIVSTGFDLCVNNGAGNDQCMLNQCTVAGAVINTPNNEGISIPPLSVSETIWVGLGSIFGGGGGNWRSSAPILDDDAVSGHVLNIQPDTIVLLNQATVSVKMDTADIKYLDSTHVLYLGRWDNTQGVWERLPATLDTVTGMVTTVDNRFGSYAPIIAFNQGCCTVPGDFTGDDSFNIADITAGIARIFSGGPPAPCRDEGDANGDNAFNIADVTFGIARIFSGGLAPVCGTTGT